ncbi:ROK family protein [Membranicola marinus]|uniref:ROK family protein n=1 Tax=Membranihabitans marinus TaxID=1227546 RepID=A0A953L8S8_9BACT|nr:ROK family protein [Membranihabitans marinus]MBY5956878.1 ROK family protein [Membranihabitans marinus]
MKYGIGIDVGGTRIKYSISNRQGKVAYHQTVDTDFQTKEIFLKKLAGIVEECQQHATGLGHEIAGISVAFPGIVEEGVVTGGAGNLPGLVPLQLTPFLKERFGLPTIAMNDAIGMAMGEHYYGAARGCSDAIFITIGTGIGGGLLIDGTFYNGFHDRGGELGHIIIERDGLPCSCGSHGCLEVYGSTSALVRHYDYLSGQAHPHINGEQLFQKYLAKDAHASQAFDWHFRNVAIGLGSLVNIFAPERIVLGGGIVNGGPQYLEGIAKYINKYCMSHLHDTFQIAPAELGDAAASVGGVGHLFAEYIQ